MQNYTAVAFLCAGKKNMNILLLCNMCNSCLILLIVAVAHLWPGDLLLKKEQKQQKGND